MNYKYSLCFLYLHYSDTRQIRQCNLPLHDFHTLETVIGYQQAAIQIGKVHRQLLLHVLGVLVDGDHLQHLVGPVEDGAARGLTFIPKARANVTIFHASRMPVHFINLILMPVKASFSPTMSFKR